MRGRQAMTGNQVSAELRHSEALKFSVVVGGRRIQLDSSDEMGQAFTPMELFLVALAGCTAMDVEWIMERQRQKLNRFDIAISGTRREEDPKYYDKINIRYSFAGDHVRKDAVEHAIQLSQEKYCSVRAMIKDFVKLNITYTIANGEQSEQEYTLALP
jgi:putative redox protein